MTEENEKTEVKERTDNMTQRWACDLIPCGEKKCDHSDS
jgi:hypothetical protein